MRLLILGASGRTGESLTNQALERGHAVTAFVRSPSKLQIRHNQLHIIQGDPRKADELERLLRDQDAVLSALGATSSGPVLEDAARSTVAAMQQTKVRRLMVVSMALLYPDVGFMGPILRFFLRSHLRDSAAMEDVVKASNLDWTIVRPPRLIGGRPSGHYRASTSTDAPPGRSITRADVARSMLDMLEQHLHFQRIVGVSK
jgi:putative NADH-flavin reductase